MSLPDIPEQSDRDWDDPPWWESPRALDEMGLPDEDTIE